METYYNPEDLAKFGTIGGKSIRVGRKILCLLQCGIRRGCADCKREIIDRTCSGTYRTVPILY